MPRSFRTCFLSVLVSLLLLAAAGASAQRRSGGQRPLPAYFAAFRSHDTEGNLTRAVFRNGLTVVIEEHAHSPLVAVHTLVRVGSFDRRPPRGLPRVYGNLLFPAFCKAIYSVGGMPKLFAGGLDTSFLSVVPAEELDDSLEAHAGLLTGELEYDPALLEFSGQAVRFQESEDRKQKPAVERDFFDWVFDLQNTEALGPFDGNQLKEFRDSFYRPANVIISVSGSIRRERVLSKLVDLLGKAGSTSEPWQGSYEVELPRPSVTQFQYRQVRGVTREPMVMMGYPVPDWRQPGHMVARLLRYMVGEGQAALLRIPRGEQSRVPFGSMTALRETAAGGLFQIGLVPEEGRLEQAEVYLLGLLEALRSNGVPAPVLDRAKALLVTDYYSSMEELSYRALSLAVSEALGDFRKRDQFPEKVAAITDADVRKFIADYMSPEKLSLMESLPPDFETRTFTSESLGETLQILLGKEVEDSIGLLENLKAGEGYQPYKPVEFVPGFSEAGLKKSSILRGPEILLRERHEVPLVHLGLFFPGGRVSETPQNAGITELLLRAALHSRIRRDSGLAMTLLGASGSRIRLINEPDFFGIEVILNSTVLETAFMKFLQIFREAPPDPEDLEAAKLQILHARTLNPSSWTSTAGERLRTQLFKNHPYGVVREDWIKNFENIDHSALMDWRQKNLEKVNPYIFVVGDVEGTSFLQSFVSRLSDSEYRTARTVERKISAPSEGEPFVKEVKHAETLTLAVRGPQRGSIFIESLDAGIRILTDCRGDLAEALGVGGDGIYGFRLWRETEVWGGPIYVEINGPEEKLERAREKILKTIEGFSSEALSERRFLTSLVGTIAEFHMRQNDPDTFLKDSMKEILAGEPPDYSSRYVLNVKQLRAGEVESTLTRFLTEEE